MSKITEFKEFLNEIQALADKAEKYNEKYVMCCYWAVINYFSDSCNANAKEIQKRFISEGINEKIIELIITNERFDCFCFDSTMKLYSVKNKEMIPIATISEFMELLKTQLK